MALVTKPRDREAPTTLPAPDEIAALEMERGGLSLKPLSLLAVVVLWQLIAMLNGVLHFYNPRLIPGPADLVVAGWNLAQTGDLQRDLAASLKRIVVGFVVSAPVAIMLGVLVARVRWIEVIVDPVVEALRPIPTLALLPIMILWFGVGEASKYFFIGYSSFFVIFTTTLLGVRNVDPILIRAGQSLGLNRLQIYRHVILPSALPDVMVGLRLGLSVAFFVIVAAEFIAADAGLGYRINFSRTWFQVDNMMLGAVVIGALGTSSNFLLVALERRLFRWKQTGP